MQEQNGADKAVEDTLRGQPFIESSVVYDKPPETWKRNCGLCFYRYGHDEKDYFPNTKKPDGREAGNYCPHFLPFTAE